MPQEGGFGPVFFHDPPEMSFGHVWLVGKRGRRDDFGGRFRAGNWRFGGRNRVTVRPSRIRSARKWPGAVAPPMGRVASSQPLVGYCEFWRLRPKTVISAR